MLFTTSPFLLFFVTSFLILLVPGRSRYLAVLALNWFYYLSFGLEYALPLALITLITFLAGLAINSRVRGGFVLGLVGNLLILAFYKFLPEVRAVFRMAGFEPAILGRLSLPIGISFYTFQAMAYLFEVRAGQQPSERNAGLLAAHISFFPSILAGPITRPGLLLPQLAKAPAFDVDNAGRGLALFAWGMFKKVVVAARAEVLVNSAYADPSNQSGPVLLIAAFLYSVQIYADFSGYPDMAIGLAQALGYKLPVNFDRPYLSASIREFWRRWHMSLSSWFRDYLYIPLGGNKHGIFRTFINVMAVFIVCGAWHGNGVQFLVWGGLHGAWIVITSALGNPYERLARASGIAAMPNTRRALGVLTTFAFVSFAWIFFRAHDLNHAFAILSRLGTGFGAILHTESLTSMFMTAGWNLSGMAGVFLSTCALAAGEALFPNGDFRNFLDGRSAVVRWMCYYAVVTAILFFGIFNNSEFIYFRF